MLDRLPITFIAPRPMFGHRRFIDVPRANHRPPVSGHLFREEK